MPLIQADAKGLEWVCAVFLSQDPVGIEEIRQGVDQHSDNEKRFGLPDRLTAKKYLFRLIYGGSAFSYANDSDFESVGGDEQFWQGVIDQTYKKYFGLKKWHDEIYQFVMKNRFLEIPSGRRYVFEPVPARNGGVKWPRTQILNYPVQGFGADMMMLARIGLYHYLKTNPVLFVSTVHDSVILDCPKAHVADVVSVIFKTWRNLPNWLSKTFNIDFNIPTRVEVKVGNDWKNMVEVKE